MTKGKEKDIVLPVAVHGKTILFYRNDANGESSVGVMAPAGEHASVMGGEYFRTKTLSSSPRTVLEVVDSHKVEVEPDAAGGSASVGYTKAYADNWSQVFRKKKGKKVLN